MSIAWAESAPQHEDSQVTALNNVEVRNGTSTLIWLT